MTSASVCIIFISTVTVTFSDPVRARQILATSDPKTQKKLGRQVENFDPVIWGKKSVEVVSKGSEHKVPHEERNFNAMKLVIL